MLNIESADIKRLGSEVRRFLGKGDLLTRLSGMATLYLEFADVHTMHTAHQSIMQALTPDLSVDQRPYEYLDDHTIKLIPIFGVSIVLSCKQRFDTRMQGSVGYRDIAFTSASLPRLEDE